MLMDRRRAKQRSLKNIFFQVDITPPPSNPDIALLGDSNTIISYFSNTVPENKWSSLIANQLNKEVLNLGVDGRRTSDFVASGANVEPTSRYEGEEEWRNANATYYIICFGLNDVSYYGLTEFENYTRELISGVQSEGGVPILMTNVWVDYPEHYSYDRNTQSIKPYDDVKRSLATELGLHLIDVYDRFKYEHDTNGVWDTRIRTTDIWDDSQDAGKTVAEGWFDNIHYNVLGNEIVADEIVSYFNANNLV